ncbi:O-antigen ligase family protein [Facklamia hominis]|uniref:O-antigen ligase family protein n=1 Tax=Facklamia hominis TaxID=178214 RepID=UPI00101D4AD9|nr:O-antigen ligase family protein [Facklamia hominis]RYC97351.1 O-antigen ligase family protein [Facklamia hominis]
MLKSLFSNVSSLSTDEKVFLLTSFAILLPYYICGPVIIMATIYLTIRHWKDLISDISQLRYLLIFVIYAIAVALYYRNYLGILLPLAFGIFGLFFLIYKQLVTARLYRWNLKIFTWGSILLAFYAFGHYVNQVLRAGYDLMYIFKYQNLQTRAQATVFNPNYYGLLIAMVLVMAIYLIFKSRSTSERILSYIAIFMNLIALILTGSRWSIPTVFLGVVMMVLALKPKLARILAVASFGLVAGLVLKPSLLPRFTNLAHGFSDRYGIWLAGWKLFETSPLIGRGSMTFVKFYYLVSDQAKMHAHQILIDSLANYGIFGMMLLILFLGPFFRGLVFQLKEWGLTPELGLIISLIGVCLFHGLMDVSIIWVQMGYMLLCSVVVPDETLREIQTS